MQYIIINGSTTQCCLGRIFSFLILWTGGRAQSVARSLPTHRTTQTQISMHRVVFEPNISAFGRAKTFQALDRSDTVIGTIQYSNNKSVYINTEKCTERVVPLTVHVKYHTMSNNPKNILNMQNAVYFTKSCFDRNLYKWNTKQRKFYLRSVITKSTTFLMCTFFGL
jgi:hypothetical protein